MLKVFVALIWGILIYILIRVAGFFIKAFFGKPLEENSRVQQKRGWQRQSKGPRHKEEIVDVDYVEIESETNEKSTADNGGR